MDKIAQLREEARQLVSKVKGLLEGTPSDEQMVEINQMLAKAEGLEKQARQLETVLALETKISEKAASSKVEVVKDAADQPFETGGEFFMAVKTAAMYPGREDPRLLSRKATGLSEGVPADGGYLLPKPVATGILERVYKTGQILSRLPIDPVTGNSMSYNAVDETSRATGSRWGGVVGYWGAEGGTMSSTKPKFRQMELKLKKVHALCYATDEQLEDTANLESWLNRVVPEELRFQTEDAIYEGDGVGKPLGIMHSPCLITVTRDTGGAIKFADLVNIWARRWGGVSDYVWFVNQDAAPQLDSIVIGTEAPPRFIDYGPEGALRIKGKPVIEVEYAATLNTTGDIMLASLSQYQAISKGGLKAAQSMHVAFTTDEMAFRFTYRIDGQPIWNSALTPFKGSNTQSPFVVLSSAT